MRIFHSTELFCCFSTVFGLLVVVFMLRVVSALLASVCTVLMSNFSLGGVIKEEWCTHPEHFSVHELWSWRIASEHSLLEWVGGWRLSGRLYGLLVRGKVVGCMDCWSEAKW